jgi:hypothetical protein
LIKIIVFVDDLKLGSKSLAVDRDKRRFASSIFQLTHLQVFDFQHICLKIDPPNQIFEKHQIVAFALINKIVSEH